MTALEVFNQNNGEVTKAYYASLDTLGPAGRIATALFRCQKRSTAAKRYRRGRHRGAAYDVKNWSLEQLCCLLHTHGSSLGITFGWKRDPELERRSDPHSWVLYVELPRAWFCPCGFEGWDWEVQPGRLPCPKCGLYEGLLYRGERQVSFHSAVRYAGSDYPGDWDGQHKSLERIISFCDRVVTSPPHSNSVTESTAGNGAAPKQAPSETEATREPQGRESSINFDALPPELQPVRREKLMPGRFGRKLQQVKLELERGGGRLAL